ncbi:MAG: SDR family NAD(P)-dependent oxidoreductase [Candidatus Dadabacteria bacterium]|nr:MAG: SDR family NAD(P)-dependent oxidoreductase [Candidatus Dadabacteria bacterium]
MIAYSSRWRTAMKQDLRRVIITGAASGLGRALAVELAGPEVVFGLIDRSETGLAETCAMLAERGSIATPVALDVRDAGRLQQVIREFAEHDGLDLLINCAGVAVFGPAESQPLEDWRLAVDVNLFGCIAGCQAAIPPMKERRSGHLVNVASAAAFTALPGMAAYNVSKAGVLALSETLAAELAPWNVAVTVVCPTFFQSNLKHGMRTPDATSARQAERFFAKASLTSEDVAKAIVADLPRRELYCFPMADARRVWIEKNRDPEAYLRRIRDWHRRAVSAS